MVFWHPGVRAAYWGGALRGAREARPRPPLPRHQQGEQEGHRVPARLRGARRRQLRPQHASAHPDAQSRPAARGERRPRELQEHQGAPVVCGGQLGRAAAGDGAPAHRARAAPQHHGGGGERGAEQRADAVAEPDHLQGRPRPEGAGRRAAGPPGRAQRELAPRPEELRRLRKDGAGLAARHAPPAEVLHGLLAAVRRLEQERQRGAFEIVG
mmetsp:Transcript_23708/g.51779  ORF Transcript_23708/g.51779 Transcript_23708/m.51779 type:complete len:212 (-) Transcript_23708:365-1000(-)